MTVYHQLSDKELIELIFTCQDQLDNIFIKEIITRREALLPLLYAVLENEENYTYEDPRFWGVIHAAHLAGILGDVQLLNALLSASRYADNYDIEWILDILPECYSRIGIQAIPVLGKHILEHRHLCGTSIASEVLGLWNIWDAYPQTRQSIEDLLLSVIAAPETSLEIRTNLIADFAKIGRSDLKPMFDDLYERGETDLNLFTRSDIEGLFNNGRHPTVRHCMLEEFYSFEEIARRQAIWQVEAARRTQEAVEEYIREHHKSIAYDAPCPCGSGRPFRQCHLAWAETAQHSHLDKGATTNHGVMQPLPVVAEKFYENEIRRFLAKKSKTALFAEIKQQVQDLMNAPIDDFFSGSFTAYFEPVLTKIGFEGTSDYKHFMKSFMEYFNAVSRQRLSPTP